MAFNIGLATVGVLVIVVGLFSEPLKKSYLSNTLVALLVGVLLSPAVFAVLDPANWGSQAVILEQAARLTMAISIMSIGLRLPRAYPLKRWRVMAVLLGPVMVLMWLVSGLAVFFVLGLPFWVAMLIGAVVTPTDPVIASTIVQGQVAEENIPGRIRHLLSAESGANDGLAYPLFFFALLLMQMPPADALWEWFSFVVLWQILGALAVGAIIGYSVGKMLEWAETKGTIRSPSYLIFTVALAITVLGVTRLMNTDGIFAVFAAGIAFSMAVDPSTENEQERIQEAVNRFFILPVFVLFGLALPWGEWIDLGWKAPVLAGAVLLFRRIPAIFAVSPLMVGRLGSLKGSGESLFYGWFGPIGVAAIYYATLAEHSAGIREAWVIGSLIIAASVLVHGVSAAPFTRLFGRRAREGGESG